MTQNKVFEIIIDPNGIRTRVTAVKGRCPRPLDDRVFRSLEGNSTFQNFVWTVILLPEGKFCGRSRLCHLPTNIPNGRFHSPHPIVGA